MEDSSSGQKVLRSTEIVNEVDVNNVNKHTNSNSDHSNNGIRHARRVGYALSQAPRFRRSTIGHNDFHTVPSQHSTYQQHQLTTAAIAPSAGNHQCYSLPFFVHQNGSIPPAANGFETQFLTYPTNHIDTPYLLFDGKGYSIFPVSMLPPNTSFNNMGYFGNPSSLMPNSFSTTAAHQYTRANNQQSNSDQPSIHDRFNTQVSTQEKAIQVDLNVFNSLSSLPKSMDTKHFDSTIPNCTVNQTSVVDKIKCDKLCDDLTKMASVEDTMINNDDDITNGKSLEEYSESFSEIIEQVDVAFSGENVVEHNLSDDEFVSADNVFDTVDDTFKSTNDCLNGEHQNDLSFTSTSEKYNTELNSCTPQINCTSQNTPKSWASLFKSKGLLQAESDRRMNKISINNNKTISSQAKSGSMKKINQTKVMTEKALIPSAKPLLNPSKHLSKCSIDANDFAKLGKILQNFECRQWSLALTPRGFSNEGNYCYVNSVLQSLLACPMFFNFIDSLPNFQDNQINDPANTTEDSIEKNKEIHAPLFISKIKYVFSQFQPMQRNNQFGKAYRRNHVEFKTDTALNIHDFHKTVDTLMRNKTKGQQEDAHEFFCRLLQELHNECTACIRTLTPPKTAEDEINEIANDIGEDDESSEWQQYYGKRVHIHREVPTDVTPISEIFCGYLRTSLERDGSMTSSNLEPFHSLSIDAESATIIQALRNLRSRVPVSGLSHPITKKPVKGYQTMLIEKLPPCLVLHLKCFSWNEGQKKIFPKMQTIVDIEIPQEIMSKTSTSHRHYKLFAIIRHCGKSVHNGHYICDVFHPGLPGWIRCDDQKVVTITNREALSSLSSASQSLSSNKSDERQELTPFILLYRHHKLNENH